MHRGPEATPGAAVEQVRERPEPGRHRLEPDDGIMFVAEKQVDGAYTITLTEDGLGRFETALAIARDFGTERRISSQSTIADIMERTAIREELSQALRHGDNSLGHRLRVALLRGELRGSEEPSSLQIACSRLLRVLIVLVIALWALRQFGVAITDIEAIPGVLGRLPGDILQLRPTLAFAQVGHRIADAGDHVVAGAIGICLSAIGASLLHPFGRIYRRDQFVPGRRMMSRLAAGMLNRLARPRGSGRSSTS